MSNLMKRANLDDSALVHVLKSSLYPGAKDESVYLVLDYCRAAGLDPMLKPVHIVPMWDAKAGQMRDVVMPGVGLYRTLAARTGQFAGMSEPEFGPDKTEKIGGVEVTYPEWARVTVKRALASGIVAEFTAKEYWTENYAVKGGKEKSIAPNAMWAKRPRGQLAKCAAAQALRIAFPELGAQNTAEELEGKELDANAPIDVVPGRAEVAPYPEDRFAQNLPKWRELVQSGKKSPDDILAMVSSKATLTDEQVKAIRDIGVTDVHETDDWTAEYDAAEGAQA